MDAGDRMLTFEVMLDHSRGEVYGLTLARHDRGMTVIDVQADGLAARWNALQPGEKIQKGDVIISGNGVTGCDDIAREFREQRLMRMTLQRSREYREAASI